MPGSAKSRLTLPIAVARYFDVSLYLLVLTGVGTLASTGTLGITAVILVGAALIFRGYLLAERRTLVIPERWTSILTVVYVMFYLADYFLISREFLGSTVHLVLFVMVVRLFSAQRERDHYLLMVISFLMVLAAAVLTVDSTFLATFGAFIFMAIITSILMEMKHASARATFQSSNPVLSMAHRRMAFSLVRVVPGLVLLIFLGGSAIFFLLPRASAGYLGAFSEGTDLTTGFSDHVELGSIGSIQQSNTLVMHVAIEGDNSGGFDLKWRGISLNQFDGRVWSDTHPKYAIPSHSGSKFGLLAFPGPFKLSGTPAPVHSIHYRVMMEPTGSSVFFLAARAQTLQGQYQLIAEDEGEAVFDEDAEHPISDYKATSNIAPPNNALLRLSGGSYPQNIQSDYEQLPSLDPRIPKLAQQITAHAQNNYDRAAAIENYLRTHFGYTLQLSRVRPRDPLAEFLFVRRRGHCEYFASSMAIMLRTLGIPSRVVNGFQTGEFNDLTSQYLVRESDAHSWVEAYFPDYGWVTFDPTPARGIEPHTGWNRTMLYMDAMASFWREWVVSYDASHQSTLKQIAARGSIQWFQRVRGRAAKEYELMLSAASRTQANIAGRPFRWGSLGLLAAIMLVASMTMRRWLRVFRRASLSGNPAKFPRAAASIWYERMVGQLARRGWRKLPSQTPAEFLTSIEDEMVKDQLAQFTAKYESARFGGSAEAASSLPQLYDELSYPGQRKKASSGKLVVKE